MNFYERFLCLCNEKNVSPSRALINAGLSKSLANKWKNAPDVAPSGVTLSKLAVYFDVPFEALVPLESDNGKPADSFAESHQGIKKEPILSDEPINDIDLNAFENYLKLSPTSKQLVRNFLQNLLTSESIE